MKSISGLKFTANKFSCISSFLRNLDKYRSIALSACNVIIVLVERPDDLLSVLTKLFSNLNINGAIFVIDFPMKEIQQCNRGCEFDFRLFKLTGRLSV